MLRIDFLFVCICSLNIISKPVLFRQQPAIQTRALPLQSSPFVTQTSYTIIDSIWIHYKLKTRDERGT